MQNKPRSKGEIVFDLKDKDGNRVVWYEDSYNHHRNDRHFDTHNLFNTVKRAIKTPQLKFKEKERNCKHFYYMVRMDKKGTKQLYMEVIINYNTVPAVILSAHLTSDTKRATISL